MVHRLDHLRPDQGALGDDALETDEVAEVLAGEGARGDVLGAEAALEARTR